MLPFPVLDKGVVLQGTHEVVLRDARLLTHICAHKGRETDHSMVVTLVGYMFVRWYCKLVGRRTSQLRRKATSEKGLQQKKDLQPNP